MSSRIINQISFACILLVAMAINSRADMSERSLNVSLGNYFLVDRTYGTRYGTWLLPSCSINLMGYTSENRALFLEYAPKYSNGVPEGSSSMDGDSRFRANFINVGQSLRGINTSKYSLALSGGLTFIVGILDSTRYNENHSVTTTMGNGFYGLNMGAVFERSLSYSFSLRMATQFYLCLGSLLSPFSFLFPAGYMKNGLDLFVGISFKLDTPSAMLKKYREDKEKSLEDKKEEGRTIIINE
jgi:hypothetical protein